MLDLLGHGMSDESKHRHKLKNKFMRITLSHVTAKMMEVQPTICIYLPMALPTNTSPHRNPASSMHGSPFSVAGMSSSGSAHHHSPNFGGWGSSSGNPSGSLTSFSDSLSQSRSQYQPGYLMVRVSLCLRECATDAVLSQHHRTLLVIFFRDKTRDINARSWLLP